MSVSEFFLFIPLHSFSWRQFVKLCDSFEVSCILVFFFFFFFFFSVLILICVFLSYPSSSLACVNPDDVLLLRAGERGLT